VVALVALTVTPVFVVNAFRVLANDWFVRYELGRDDFPVDRYGLDDADRLALAIVGLRSIEPGGEGVALLERARLPDGSSAFDGRELRHMRDVRERLGIAFRAQLLVVVVIVTLGFTLRRSVRWRVVVPRGLLVGALATLAIALLVVPTILLGFDGFFLRFHELFFSGNSWRFSNTDTLLRIYPETFWQDTARFAAAMVVAQAVVVAVVAALWLRRLGGPAVAP
jgi:integral membrane protein (TIGR01906 family)